MHNQLFILLIIINPSKSNQTLSCESVNANITKLNLYTWTDSEHKNTKFHSKVLMGDGRRVLLVYQKNNFYFHFINALLYLFVFVSASASSSQRSLYENKLLQIKDHYLFLISVTKSYLLVVASKTVKRVFFHLEILGSTLYHAHKMWIWTVVGE